MSYFIFLKDLDNVEGTIYKIAENEIDLNNLNINQSDYKIIEDSQVDFNLIKLNNKLVSKYDGNNITFIDQTISFKKKEDLQNYLINCKNQIEQFINININHPQFSLWNNYFNQLNSLNLDDITYPLNKSLEQYFNDLGQPYYNILQIP